MRTVYLHGFMSGPGSAKAVLLDERARRHGRVIERPDLNVPSAETLRVGEMIRAVGASLAGGPDTLLVGSSLGGLVALHVQASHLEVVAVVLLAPALEADRRWVDLVQGERGLALWRRRGRFPFFHHARKCDVEVDIGFLDDLLAHSTPPPLRVPAEIVQGRRDETVRPEVASRYASRRRKLTRLTLVDDDHSLLRSIDAIESAIERAECRANPPGLVRPGPRSQPPEPRRQPPEPRRQPPEPRRQPERAPGPNRKNAKSAPR